MAENVGGIYWTASIETQGLVNGERAVVKSTVRAGRNFDNMERKAAGLNTTLTRLAKTIVGVFAVRQIQRFTMETIRNIDEQGKFAQQLGVSFENLQKLQFAAEQSGGSITQLNNSLRRGSRNIQQAADGTGSAVDALEALNLEARELAALAPDEQFAVLADAISGVESASEQAAIAYRIFGRDGEFLLNTLRNGSDGLRELGDEAERSGRVLSQQAADDAAKFQDELNKLQGAAKGAAVTLGAELVPRMTDLITAATDWLSTGDNVENLIKGIGVVAQTTAAILAGRLVASIWASIRAMQAAAVGARSLTGALALLGGPVGIIATVVTGLGMIALSTRKANAAQQDNERTVANLAQRYEDLSDAQLRLLQLDIKQEMRDIERATEGMTDAFGTAQGALSGLNADELQGLGDYLGVEIDTSTQEREAASLARLKERYEELKDALTSLESERSTRARSTASANEQTEESVKSITSLAERNEELRAALAGTSEELEVRRALLEAGVEAGSAEANVIEALVRGNHDLAQAIRERAEEEQRRQELEGVAASGIGLTRLQALKEEYEMEQQLLLDAQAAGIESTISYQERLTELERQYAEERKSIMADEAQSRKLVSGQLETTLGAMGDMFGNFANAAREGGEDSFKAYKRLATAQAMISTFMAINNALATPAPFPIPQILAASIGAMGLMNVSKIQGMQYGGGRQYGGGVTPDKSYRVNETEPEMFVSGGQQYLIPNMRGEVMNSKQVGGGDVNVSIRVNNNAPGVDVGVRQQGIGNDRQFILDVVKADITGYGQSTVGALTTVTNIKRKTQ